MKYVLGDIHGEYDKFIRMLRLIDFKESDTLYVIGDCVDRGDEGIKVLQHIMRNPNMELIWGNHEKLMMDYIETGSGVERLNWFWNGGIPTNNGYKLLSENEKSELCDFIKNLPYFKIVDKYILCHAGIRVAENASDKNVEEILQNQSVEDLLWIREDFYNRKAIDGHIVIFGHTPVVHIDQCTINDDAEFCAWYDKRYNDKIGIDCAAPQSYGRLCCIRLEDLKEFYV